LNMLRILVTEDNAADLFLLRHGFARHGERFVLEVLKDGEEALRFIGTHTA